MARLANAWFGVAGLIFGATLAIATGGLTRPAPDFEVSLDAKNQTAVLIEYPNLTAQLDAVPSFRLIPRNLPWTTAQLALARKAIRQNSAKLEHVFFSARANGATRILVSSTSPSHAPLEQFNSYPDFAHLPYLHDFVPLTKTGRHLAAKVEYDGPQLAFLALFQMQSGECSLTHRELLVPSSWFEPNTCEFKLPTPGEYLRASLINDLYARQSPYTRMSDIWMSLNSQLEQGTQHRFTNQTLIFSRLASGSTQTRFPLKGSRAGTNYEFRLESDTYAQFDQHEPTIAQRMHRASLMSDQGFLRITFFGD